MLWNEQRSTYEHVVAHFYKKIVSLTKLYLERV